MEKWYNECIEFLENIKEFENEDFTYKKAVNSLKILKDYYDNENFEKDINNKIRMDNLIKTVLKYKEDKFYPLWMIWMKYFVSQGCKNWNMLWNDLDDSLE
ncbi:MAG: hypothetical protein ACI4VF_10205 [Lachnospirales bacterium]